MAITRPAGGQVLINGYPAADVFPDWDPVPARYEIQVNSTLRVVDQVTFRSWTGRRWKNGREFHGPVFVLGTAELTTSGRACQCRGCGNTALWLRLWHKRIRTWVPDPRLWRPRPGEAR